MNVLQRTEDRALTREIRKSFPKKTRFTIEIWAVADAAGREFAGELLADLRLGGLDAAVVEVAEIVREEILIESSPEAAGLALALQSAFLRTGRQVQLLVHEKAQPRRLILHLGMAAARNPATK